MICEKGKEALAMSGLKASLRMELPTVSYVVRNGAMMTPKAKAPAMIEASITGMTAGRVFDGTRCDKINIAHSISVYRKIWG